MNKDELKGKMENLKGRVKEATGALTGNKGKQAEGMAIHRARLSSFAEPIALRCPVEVIL